MPAARRVALLGAKGGCGTTTLAVNLAAALAGDKTVCAIDLDAGKGDLAGLLDITPGTTVPDLLGTEFDAALLRGGAAHHRGGFSVLAQPQDLSRLARPLPSEARYLLDVASEAWASVIVDLGSRIDEAVLGVLTHVDQVVIVAMPDVLSIRDVVRIRLLLDRIGVQPANQHYVLNRVPRHPAVPLAEIEALLRWPPLATICEDPDTCLAALAGGQLLRERAPNAAITDDVERLSHAILGETPPPRSWWPTWLGGAT